MSFKYEVKLYNDPKFYTNGVAFATEEEANRAGHAKMMAWMMVDEYRVVPSDEKPNYSISPDGTIEHIKEPA